MDQKENTTVVKSNKNYFGRFIGVQADLPPISTCIPYEDYCVILKLSSISLWPQRPPLVQIRILPEFVATLPLTHRQLHTPASWGREFVCYLVPFARNFILKLNYLQIVYICGKMRHIGTIRLFFYFLLHFIDVLCLSPSHLLLSSFHRISYVVSEWWILFISVFSYVLHPHCQGWRKNISIQISINEHIIWQCS